MTAYIINCHVTPWNTKSLRIKF